MSRTRDDLLSDLDLLGFEREVRFRGLSGKRRFKFDSAYVSPDGGTRVAVDYHGWGSGAGHMARGKQSGDHEKANEAMLCGWKYVVCDAINVGDGRCWSWVMMALGDEA